MIGAELGFRQLERFVVEREGQLQLFGISISRGIMPKPGLCRRAFQLAKKGLGEFSRRASSNSLRVAYRVYAGRGEPPPST
jgi:hypothetical protein